MENNVIIKIEKFFNNNDLIEIRNNFNELFENIEVDKTYFLDYFEYTFLINKKLYLETQDTFDNSTLDYVKSRKIFKIEYLQKWIAEKRTQNIIEAIDLSDTKATEKNVPDYDANHFNKKGYDLFLYLVENYTKNGKIKYVNIFEFMRKGIDKKKYVFGFTQDSYKVFILSKFDVKITKFEVAQYLYEDKEKHVLNSHEQQFGGR